MEWLPCMGGVQWIPTTQTFCECIMTGINDQGVIQPGESLIPLTTVTWSVSLNTYIYVVKNLQYVLSTVELFLVLFLLYWLLWWTDHLVLFFVKVASRRLRSAHASALDFAKYVRCKGPAAQSSLSSIAKKTSSRCRCVMHMVSNIPPGRDRRHQIDIPKRDRHVHTYVRMHVHCENRSLIQSLTLMCSAINEGSHL